MNLAVLGARGFIGKAIANALSIKPFFTVTRLTSEDADLTDPAQTASLAKAIVGGSSLAIAASVTRDRRDDLGSMLDNVRMAVNIARLISRADVSHVIYLSTVDVYGREWLSLPLDEESPIRPSSYYAISKYAAELILRRACADRGAPFAVLRLPGVYGPGDTHMSPIRIFITAAVEGSEVKVDGDGSQRRDFLFVEDIPRAVETVLSGKADGVFNLVTGRGRSIKEVLDIIGGIAGRRLDVTCGHGGPGSVDLVFRESALLGVEPGFRFTGLPEGIRRTYEHLMENKG